jgi:hypothetical protein
MVYPGTSAFQDAKDRGYIQIEDWSAWLTKDGLHNSIVTLPNITHEQLVSFCDRARRSFYLSPPYLLYKLKQSLKDRRELQRNLKGFITLSKYRPPDHAGKCRACSCSQSRCFGSFWCDSALYG